MVILARSLTFVQSLRRIAERSDLEWRQCPGCGSTDVHRHGVYRRYPYMLEGRQTVVVQRYRCQKCGATYSQEHPDLPPKAWYARSVRRMAIDQWLFTGSSLRRVAEWMRSLMNKRERWQIWQPLSQPDAEGACCKLCASTVQQWIDEAGQHAERRIVGLYAGLPPSRLLGADGLWARLRGGTMRVLLMLRDSVTGLLWPPVVVKGEEAAEYWQALLAEAQQAGLGLEEVLAVVSDGAQGLLSHLRQNLPGVYQQRCIFHTWRNLGGELGRQAVQAAQGLEGEAAHAAREGLRRQLGALVAGVLDAPTTDQAEEALGRLRVHPQGQGLWRVLNERFLQLLAHRMPAHQGLGRVTPEWMWRDYRLRLSRGRNHGNERRLRRAGVLFSIFRNCTPAQMRREHARQYRHPGRSALEVAGVDMQGCSYMDFLEI